MEPVVSLAMLMRDLASGSRARLQTDSGDQWVAREWQGEVLDPPVRLSVTEQSLAAYVGAVGKDARTIFPDVDAEVAGYRLLLVHLDECFAGGIPTETVVTRLHSDGAGPANLHYLDTRLTARTS